MGDRLLRAAPEARDSRAGGRLYFLVQGVLWRSDGTAAGTAPVADLCQAPCYQLHDLAAVGDTLFFGALEVGSERVRDLLWRSDGTLQGTQALRVMLDLTFADWAARSRSGVARLTSARAVSSPRRGASTARGG